MKLKINDIAKLFDCTTEALRYYEKEGVLIPERDPENNYRYYTAQHLKLLAKCSFLKSAGFSVKESIDIMTNGTIDDIGQRLIDKEAELIKEAQKLLQISQALSSYRKKIEMIPSRLNTYTVTKNPEFIYIINQHKMDLFKNPDLTQLITKWFRNFPIVNLCVLVKYAEFVKKDSLSRYHGYCLNASLVDAQVYEDSVLSKRLEPRKCLYTVQSFNVTQESRIASVRSMHDYIKSNNYVVNGDMFGIQLFINHERSLTPKAPNGELFYEYWIPIE